MDVERVRRINHTINLVPAEARAASGLRPIDLLVITPSERIDAVAAKHVDALPRPVRALLGGVGVTADKSDFRGAALASYLLFEAPYTQDLMALGRADTLRQRSEVVRFFGPRRCAAIGARFRCPAVGAAPARPAAPALSTVSRGSAD